MITVERRRCFILVGVALLCWLPADSQSFQEFKKQSQARFEAKKQQQKESMNEFRNRINLEFSARLGRPWQLQSAAPAKENPLKELPPPPVSHAPASSIPKPESRYDVVRPHLAVSHSDDSMLSGLENRPEHCSIVSFSFLGDNVVMHHGELVRLGGTKESDIAQAWEAMVSPGYDLLANSFWKEKRRLQLCDWATLSLAIEASHSMHEKSADDAVLLQMWLLSQVGLQTAMAKDENGRLRLLVAADKQIFNYPSFFIEDTEYYVVDGAPIKSARLQAGHFPGTRPLSMAFTVPFSVEEKPTRGKRGIVDRNRLDYYGRCPDFCDDGNPVSCFYYYAMVPLSESARHTLYPVLKKRIEGKSAPEAADILLSYIHKEYPYMEDEKVWHRERYFYAEEALAYDYTDCEDRAILYTWLVRDLLGLKTALLYYPGHLAAAVRFGEKVVGDATLVNGERYLICDPTYIGAHIGMEMTVVERSKAVVIPL